MPKLHLLTQPDRLTEPAASGKIVWMGQRAIRWWRGAAATALLALGAAPLPPVVDLVIRGGTIYPGGAAPFVGDVAIRSDRIVAIAPHLGFPATHTIDARGMIVAPGFIDPHTHIEGALAAADQPTRLIPAFLTQGVTTAFIGNDGGGSPDIARTLAGATTRPVGINYAAYVGFGSVRTAVIGEADRTPTGTELGRMKAMVAGAMCHGALGLSTGLFYAPQSFAGTDEVAAVAREAATRGGVYDTHIRDESSYSIGLAAAIDEALAIGRAVGMPVHISHIKALGVDVQGKAGPIVARIDRARATGQSVTADQYPWSASGTSLVAALVPLWAQDGGVAALRRRIDDPAIAVKLSTGMTENLRRRGGAGALLVTEGRYAGRTLGDIARAMRLDPIAAAIAVIRMHDPAVASFNQIEPDITAFMKQPWVMTGSDASTGHPRAYATFARKYAKYVVADKVISLRDFIDRSTSLTADTFGLKGRGHLRTGSFADIVVFDPRAYAPRATYRQPTLRSVGVRTVLVNGVIALDRGVPTGRAAGRALPHDPPPGSCG